MSLDWDSKFKSCHRWSDVTIKPLSKVLNPKDTGWPAPWFASVCYFGQKYLLNVICFRKVGRASTRRSAVLQLNKVTDLNVSTKINVFIASDENITPATKYYHEMNGGNRRSSLLEQSSGFPHIKGRFILLLGLHAVGRCVVSWMDGWH